jgi:hypothetical protein
MLLRNFNQTSGRLPPARQLARFRSRVESNGSMEFGNPDFPYGRQSLRHKHRGIWYRQYERCITVPGRGAQNALILKDDRESVRIPAMTARFSPADGTEFPMSPPETLRARIGASSTGPAWLRRRTGHGAGWRLEAGGWRLEAGGWRLEAGGWRLEAGGWRLGIRSRAGWVCNPVPNVCGPATR